MDQKEPESTTTSLQALQQESAALLEEAQRNPESDAALMARVLIFEGLLSNAELGEGEQRARARLEAREAKKKLEKPVKSVEDMDPMMVYNKIFEIVGLRGREQIRAEQTMEQSGDGGDESENQ